VLPFAGLIRVEDSGLTEDQAKGESPEHHRAASPSKWQVKDFHCLPLIHCDSGCLELFPAPECWIEQKNYCE